MWLGKPTGSAMPLMWAHAEYIKLLRSSHDGKVYDAIPEVAARYLAKRGKRKQLAVWKPNRHVRFMRPGETLRVHMEQHPINVGRALGGLLLVGGVTLIAKF